MKQKTHSGAKKRLRKRPGGTVKRSQVNKRHILQKKTAKRKRQLGTMLNVDDANMYQVKRLLAL